MGSVVMLRQFYAEKNGDFSDESQVDQQEHVIVESALIYMAENLAEPLTLAELARRARMSRSAFCRLFQRCSGIPPMRWLWFCRVQSARDMIVESPDLSLTDVAFACGFSCSAHFSRCFKRTFGISPRAFRQALLLSRGDKSQRGN